MEKTFSYTEYSMQVLFEEQRKIGFTGLGFGFISLKRGQS